jgi:L-alanine-DL-glutamate epimerase-like enolase superfamily enzyme
MKITDIRAIPLERRLNSVYKGGTYRIDSRYTLVMEVELEDGTLARTFGGDEERYQKDIACMINEVFRELLVGRNVLEVERHWQTMFESSTSAFPNRGIHTLDLANKAVLMQAISAVDICLWDAIGRYLGQPLYRLLGGYRDRVPVIAIGGYYSDGKGEQELRDELCRYRRDELAGVKMKVGMLAPRDDAERVRFAREVVGPDFLIACDANQAWTTRQAIEFCDAVRGLGIRWLEEPIIWYDQLDGLPRVRQQGGLPVTAGQGEISRYGCRDLIRAGAVDILNVDATIAGGITEWRRIAGMAACAGIDMAHHEEPQVSVHMLASTPHGLYVEIFGDAERDPMWFDLPVSRPRIRGGYMEVPQGPGLGMELNLDVIERFRASGSAAVSTASTLQ